MDGTIDFEEYMEDAFKLALQIVKKNTKGDDNSQTIAASNLALPLFNAKIEELFHILFHEESDDEQNTA